MKIKTFFSILLRVALDIITLGAYELLKKKFGSKSLNQEKGGEI